jgi:hypothetical protein
MYRGVHIELELSSLRSWPTALPSLQSFYYSLPVHHAPRFPVPILMYTCSSVPRRLLSVPRRRVCVCRPTHVCGGGLATPICTLLVELAASLGIALVLPSSLSSADGPALDVGSFIVFVSTPNLL